jgi:hypothetical protein
MIDKVHGRSEGTAGRNFRANRDRFIEGDDFYHFNYQEVSLNDEFRRVGKSHAPFGASAPHRCVGRTLRSLSKRKYHSAIL